MEFALSTHLFHGDRLTRAHFEAIAALGFTRVELFATNLFDSNGRYATSLQCQETVCGDPDGVSGTGPVFYDYTIKPRTVGLKIGVDF